MTRTVAIPVAVARHAWVLACAGVATMLLAVVASAGDPRVVFAAAVGAGAAVLAATTEATGRSTAPATLALFAVPTVSLAAASSRLVPPLVLVGAAVVAAQLVIEALDRAVAVPTLAAAAGVSTVIAATALGAQPGMGDPWRIAAAGPDSSTVAVVGLLAVFMSFGWSDRRAVVVLAAPLAPLALALAADGHRTGLAVVAAGVAIGAALRADPGTAGLAVAVAAAAAGPPGPAALLGAGAVLALALRQPAGALAALPGALAVVAVLTGRSIDAAAAAALVAVAGAAGAVIWRWRGPVAVAPWRLPAAGFAAWLVLAPGTWGWVGPTPTATAATGAARAVAVGALALVGRALLAEWRPRRGEPGDGAVSLPTEPDAPPAARRAPAALAWVALVLMGLATGLLVVSYLRLR